MKRKGFTLIELLVVMTIISILAAMLFPAFASAKAAALQTVCISNMKQVGTALTMYSEDYDGLLPNATHGDLGAGLDGGWVWYEEMGGRFDVKRGSLYTYIRNADIYKCPMDGDGKSKGNSYALSGCMLQEPQMDSPYVIGAAPWSLPDEASQIMLVEEEVQDGWFRGTTNDGYFNPYFDHVTERHTKGTVVVHLDTSTKKRNSQRVQAEVSTCRREGS